MFNIHFHYFSLNILYCTSFTVGNISKGSGKEEDYQHLHRTEHTRVKGNSQQQGLVILVGYKEYSSLY